MRRFPSSWNATLAKLGFKLKKQRAKQSVRHRSGGYGRRASLEQLESRELLTGTPWQGTTLVTADFDGDGNVDRLGSMAASTSSPETWSIDTKASSAAGMVEKWQIVRGSGAPAVVALPVANQFFVGDFNGDGRDDILSRSSTGPWYMIQGRASSAPSDYQGDFFVTPWGSASASGIWSQPVVGDFNGDGRDDLAAFNDSNPVDKQWQVMTSTGTAFNLPATWASQQTVTPTAGTIVAGDFNGDGRDDLWFKKSATSNWAIAVSNGSRFNVLDPAGAVTTTWTTGRKGNFDGDGGDELLGWNSTWNSGAGRWETLQYDDHRGMSLDVSWGNYFGTPASSTTVHVGDANRDGRDDLVVYYGNKWNVALSQQLSNGTNSFAYQPSLADGTNDWDRWFKDWDWGPTTAAYTYLNVDAPYQKFLDVFSDVYNTVELELYPGLMKGIEATDQTKAGNDWDQAALLVDRLEGAGFDADIAYGTVTANGQQAALWIGTETVGAAYSAIKGTVDANAILLSDGSIRFKHAWVRAIVPTMGGFVVVDVDPSWKFKDRQPGVSGTPNAFDEFGYLSQNGNALPVEYFEDQVMAHLNGTPLNESLAEVPYDGPILQRQFAAIPNNLEAGVAIYDSNPADGNDEVEQYEKFAEIAGDITLAGRFTHRATLSLARELDSGARTTPIIPPNDFVFGSDYVPGAMYVTGGIQEYELHSDDNSFFPAFDTDTDSDYITEFNPNGQRTRFFGTPEDSVAVQLPESYTITPNTRIRFDIEGRVDQPDSHFVLGYDADLSAITTPNNGERRYYQIDQWSPYTVILDPTAHGFTIQYLIVGLHGMRLPAFGNLLIYEDRGYEGTHTGASDGRVIVLGTEYSSLPISGDGVLVTSQTLLQVEFKSELVGALHAIGWDDDGFAARALYQLGGTQTYPGYGTNYNVEPSSDGYSRYTIPIGTTLLGTESTALRRIVFHTEAGASGSSPFSYFRNIKILAAADTGAVGEHWTSTPIIIPTHSLSSINIDYVKTENSTATAGDDSYRSRLWINGAIAAEGTSAEILQTGDRAKVRVQHQSPTEFGISPPSTVADKTYNREPGQILAISFDANQYSREYLVGLQAGLNARLEDGDDVSDIDELLSYTGAKYWYEFNRSNRTVDGLMHTIGGQQWVGSGIVTADPYLLVVPDTAIAHLQFPIVPHDMGVDLPNVTHVSFDLNSGTRSNEAFQLMSFNSSALENAILEEVVNSESISTARGLQRAYANQRGLRFDNSTISREAVQVFDSVPNAGGRTIYFRGEVGYSAVTPYLATRTNMTRTRSQLLSLEDGGLKNHVNEAARIADILENVGSAAVGTIRILVPRSRSQLGDWTGTVYVAEFDTATGRSGAYIISPDSGAPTSGGYIGNVAKPENKSLPPATFLNQTYAGDPVNVANGNMFRDEVDFTFANPIIPLDFARHYDSQNKLDIGFGVGWVHGFTGFIYEEQDPATATDKDYVWLRGNGERHTFEDLNFTLPNTLFGDIQTSVGPGGSATDRRLTAFLDRDGTKYIFEPIYSANAFTDQTTGKQILGRLVSIQDATGTQGVNIAYESANSIRVTKVASISSPSRYLQFVYNANNSIDVKRFEGSQLIGTWAYVLATHASYSGKRLTQVKHADQTSVTSTTTYDYIDDGPASRRGLIKKITEPNGESHSYEYYANGRVFRVTDGAGNQQSFNFNLFRNLTEFTDENGNVETYIHQDNGLLTKQIHDDRSRMEFTWGGGWEEFLMTSSTDERDANESFEYFDFYPESPISRPGELKWSISKDGNRTDYEYWPHTYISSVKKVTVTTPNNESTVTARNTYDGFGNLSVAEDADEHFTEYYYYGESDPAHVRGLRKSQTLPKGMDSLRQSWETYEAVDWKTLANSFEVTGNDLTVQLLTSTSGQFLVADAVRIDRVDEDGILTRTIDSADAGGGSNFRFETGVATSAVSSASAFGRQAYRIGGTSTEQIGATWTFRDIEPGTYRVAVTWVPDPTNSSNARYHLSDGLPDGIPTQLVSGINQRVAPDSFHSYQTVYEYDTAGNVTRAITEGLPSGRRAYDSFGNVVYEEDATGVATVYTYDALGRLTKSTVVDPQEMTFTPGPAGNVKSYPGTGGWDVSPNSYEVRDGGDTLYLFDGARKGVALDYLVTTNTVLEFDFEAVGNLGEFQAIAISHSLNAQAAENFALAGTRNGDWPDVVNWQYHGQQANSGPKHYRIPIGTHVPTGLYQYLAFINQDAGTFPNSSTPANEGKSYFSNIRIYESTGTSNVATTTYAYDASGRVKNATDALGRTTTYAYDKSGRLVKTSFADGTFTAHEYDEIGNCVAIADELDRTTHYVYDDRNRLIQTIYADGASTRIRYDGAGQLVASIDERNYLTQLTYDKAGRLLTTTAAVDTADQTRSVNKYDSRGRLVESVDGNGIVTKYKTDNLGRVTQTTVLDRIYVSSDTVPTPLVTSRAPIYVSTTEYDSNGNVARTAVYDPLQLPTSTNDYSTLLQNAAFWIDAPAETDNKVQVVRAVFDAFGRAVQVTNADGTSTSTIYDAAGRVRFTFDELGRRTELQYDQFGRLEKAILPDPDGIGSGQSPQTRYVRNNLGNVTQEWEFFGAFGGGTNLWYANLLSYDVRNRRTTTTDPNEDSVQNVYDVAGQLVGTVDAMGNATYAKYDERGRVITQRLADPDGSGTQFAPETGHEYDAAGNIIATTDPVGNATTFTYDGLNRVRLKSSYHELVLDDSDDPLDASFGVVGSPSSESSSAGVGRDYTAISQSTARATWTSPSLEAGQYRISMTWVASGLWAPSAAASVYLNDLSTGSTIQLNQTVNPVGFEEIDGDRLRNWQVLNDSLTVSAGQQVKVELVKAAGLYLFADAVRFDRLVSTAYAYDKNGNLSSDKDTLDHTTTYVYDELNRLRQTISADPDGTTTTLRSLITENTYDGFGNVIVEQKGHLMSATDAVVDRTNTFEYDQRNRLTEKIVDSGTGRFNVTTGYEYDDAGNTTLVTDAEGFTTHYRYDDVNRVIDEYQDVSLGLSAAAPLVVLSTPTSSNGSTYDGTTTLLSGGTAVSLAGHAWSWFTIPTYHVTHETILEFNFLAEDVGLAHAIGFDTDANFGGSSETARYFELGGESPYPFFTQDFRQERLADGTIRIPIGQYLTDSEKASGLDITRLAFINRDNRTGLDAADLGKSIFSNLKLYESDEVRTVTTYDTRGNVETVREASDPRKITTRYVYDRLGQQTDRVLDSGGSTERVYKTYYDANGNVTGEESPASGTGPASVVQTVHEYDRLNRLIKTTLPDPDGIPGGATGLASEVTTFTYDAAGNLIQEKNGENESTYTAYDQDGRVTSEFDGNGDETRYRYDSAGNLLAVTDAEQNTTSYTYDGLGRVTEETITALVGGVATPLTRRYVYNAAGNLERLFNRNGTHTHFYYDTLDRKNLQYWRNSSTTGGTVLHVQSWEYDKLDRITKQVDGNKLALMVVNSVSVPNTVDDIVDTYVYDGLGRLVEQRNYDPATAATQGQSSGIPPVRQKYQYVYETDSSGLPPFYKRVYRIQEQFTAGGTLGVGKTQSQFDRLDRLIDTSDYDPNAAAGPVIEWNHVRFAYDAADNLDSIKWFGNYAAGSWGNTLLADLVYDKADRLTSITHDLATDIVHTYAYDNASRVTSFDSTGSETATATRTYSYDNDGQLTSAPGSGESYTYDDNGNRVTVGGQAIVTELANRLTNDGTYTYVYDNEGNQIRRTPLAGISAANPVVKYGYDHRNRLTSVTSFSSVADADAGTNSIQVINYTYDAQDRRVKRAFDANGGTPTFTNESFIYDGDELSMRFDGAGELTHRYLYGPAVDQVLVDEVFVAGTGGQRVSDEVLWQLADQQGTIREIVNDHLVVRKDTDFDSFGQVTGEQFYAKNGSTIGDSHAEAIEQLFGYTGQERDEATELQLHGKRWYDPFTGRWRSTDPSGLGPDSNLYRYVGNNPTNFTDPTGLSQAGNPLTNLFAGGYSGNKVTKSKPVNPFVASASSLVRGAVGTVTAGLNNLASGFNSVSTAFAAPRIDPILQQMNAYSVNQFLANPNPYADFNRQVVAQSAAIGIEAFNNRRIQETANLFAQADILGTRFNDPLAHPRVQAGFTVVQGLGEATIATGLLAFPDATLTKVGAALLYAKAFDSLQAGARGLYYGEAIPTVTYSTVQSSAEYVGIPRSEASFFAGLADAGPSFVGGVELAALRNGGRAVPKAVPSQLTAGRAREAQRLADLGLSKNTNVWRPSLEQTDSAAFRVVVGEPNFTPGGLPVGTVIDATPGGLFEYKSGTSVLNSSYQLRLQTYRSLIEDVSYTIETTRPANSTFQGYLQRWGVNIQPPD